MHLVSVFVFCLNEETPFFKKDSQYIRDQFNLAETESKTALKFQIFFIHKQSIYDEIPPSHHQGYENEKARVIFILDQIYPVNACIKSIINDRIPMNYFLINAACGNNDVSDYVENLNDLIFGTEEKQETEARETYARDKKQTQYQKRSVDEYFFKFRFSDEVINKFIHLPVNIIKYNALLKMYEDECKINRWTRAKNTFQFKSTSNLEQLLYNNNSWHKYAFNMNNGFVGEKLRVYEFDVFIKGNVEDDIVNFLRLYIKSARDSSMESVLIIYDCPENERDFTMLPYMFPHKMFFNNISFQAAAQIIDNSVKNHTFNFFELLHKYNNNTNKRYLYDNSSLNMVNPVMIPVFNIQEITNMKKNINFKNYKFTDLEWFSEYYVKLIFIQHLIQIMETNKDMIITTEVGKNDSIFKHIKQTTYRKPKIICDNQSISFDDKALPSFITDFAYKIDYDLLNKKMGRKAPKEEEKKFEWILTDDFESEQDNEERIRRSRKRRVEEEDDDVDEEIDTSNIQKKDASQPNNQAIVTAVSNSIAIIKNTCDKYRNEIKNNNISDFKPKENDQKKLESRRNMLLCRQYLLSIACLKTKECGEYFFINCDTINEDYNTFLEKILNNSILLTQSKARMLKLPYWIDYYITCVHKHTLLHYAIVLLTPYERVIKKKYIYKELIQPTDIIIKNPLRTKEEIITDLTIENMAMQQAHHLHYEHMDKRKENEKKINTAADEYDSSKYFFCDIAEIEFILRCIDPNITDIDMRSYLEYFIFSGANNRAKLLESLSNSIFNNDVPKIMPPSFKPSLQPAILSKIGGSVHVRGKILMIILLIFLIVIFFNMKKKYENNRVYLKSNHVKFFIAKH